MPLQYLKDFAGVKFFNVVQIIQKEIESREEKTKKTKDTTAQGQQEQNVRIIGASLLPFLRSDLLLIFNTLFWKS